jgi:glycosyltransferase involved in cell wall biosynthesis
MKILAFTAGAAQMYCGSCIRDNALAAELKRQGHDVVLLPIYTPTLTDEQNVSDERIFFGGISVYLQQHSALFRKTPVLFDRLWDSKWALKLASKRSIPVDARLLGEMTVSMLRGEDGLQQKEIHKLTAWLSHEAPPEIVTLPNSLLIGLARAIREASRAPLCCTLQGEDLFLSLLHEPYRTQAIDLIRSNVNHVDGFAAVSEYAAEAGCRQFGIPDRKMHVVPLGINLDGYEPASRRPHSTFTVGFFARIAPEKGLHVLAEAYIRMRREHDFPCSLEAAGYLAPEHADYLRGIERKVQQAGFASGFHYRGSIDRARKLDFFRSIDVMSVPATYDEPKGLSVLEAMAAGVPVVLPRRGSFPEILERTRGGLLTAPDDPNALVDAILTLRNDPALAADLGARGAHGVRQHYSASAMAASALHAYGCIANARVHA